MTVEELQGISERTGVAMSRLVLLTCAVSCVEQVCDIDAEHPAQPIEL